MEMYQARGPRKGQRFSMTHASRETRFAAVKAALRVRERCVSQIFAFFVQESVLSLFALSCSGANFDSCIAARWFAFILFTLAAVDDFAKHGWAYLFWSFALGDSKAGRRRSLDCEVTRRKRHKNTDKKERTENCPLYFQVYISYNSDSYFATKGDISYSEYYILRSTAAKLYSTAVCFTGTCVREDRLGALKVSVVPRGARHTHVQDP